MLVGLLPDDVRGADGLDGAARLAGSAGTTTTPGPPRRRWARSRASWRARPTERGPAGAAVPGAGAGRARGDHRRGRCVLHGPAGRRGRADATRSGTTWRSASTPATRRSCSRIPGGAAHAGRRRRDRGQGAGLLRARAARPGRRRDPRPRWPRSTSRASCTRPAPATRGPTTCAEALAELPRDRPWRVHFHVPIARRRRTARSAPPEASLSGPRRRAPRDRRHAPLRGRDLHLVGAARGRAAGRRRRGLVRASWPRSCNATRQETAARPSATVDGSPSVRTNASGDRSPGGHLSSVVVIDVVGLTPQVRARHAGAGGAGRQGVHAPMGAVLPAVTCSAQATMLTGTMPARARHRRQRLVLPRPVARSSSGGSRTAWCSGEKVWERRAADRPGVTCAKLFWWYAMYSTAD